MALSPTITLNDGSKIPSLGFGTFASPNNVVGQAVLCAIESGYRHIDCAFFYDNEEEVGTAIAKGMVSKNLKREDLYITSKLWCDSHKPSDVRPACEKSLKKLGLKCLDLYLVHWPTDFHIKPGKQFDLSDPSTIAYESNKLEDTWQAMEGLVTAGLTKSIGVSNFNKKQLDRILSVCKIPPVVNQVEVSIHCMNEKLVEYCHEKGVHVEAYAPFGSPGVMVEKVPSIFEEPSVMAIAAAHNKAPAQVLLRHALQRGLVVLVKSVTPSRIVSNFDVFNFELTDTEMHTLNTSGRNIRLFAIPSLEGHPEYPFNDEF